MRRAVLLGFGVFALALSPLHAQTAYTINFTTQFGTAPTAGSFSYDAPTQTFSSFLVTWAGVSFDLTAPANAATAVGTCDSPDPNSADLFAYMNGNGCSDRFWQATVSPVPINGGTYRFNVGQGGQANYALATQTVEAGQSSASGAGGFTITATNVVPEPSTYALLGVGLAGVAAVARRRQRHKVQHLVHPAIAAG